LAIYFLNVKSIGRAGGSSAVGASAYRSGERIHDERSGKTYDHSARQDVLHKEVVVPEKFAAHDMAWANDRASLWNLAEASESRKHARVAREYLVVLPFELSPEQRLSLAKQFSRELVERYRFALDLAVHAPRDFPGSDPRNFHAHLLATTREVTSTGLGAKTAMEWSDTKRREAGLSSAAGEILHVRQRWAEIANESLRAAQLDARIDHRTLRAQGIDREPKLWIPRVAYEVERRGGRSVLAERIREEHQARVDARLQATAQKERAPAAHRSLKDSIKAWLRRGEALAPKLSQDEPAKESATARAASREALAPKLSQDEPADEAAQNWTRYRESHPSMTADEAAQNWVRHREAHLRGREQTRTEQAEKEQERQQRSHDNDFSL
jgi:ATP-dependent exoDNAse (exonuclease V) alpha subunit